MHLISNLITFTCLLTLGLATPILPTQHAGVAPIGPFHDPISASTPTPLTYDPSSTHPYGSPTTFPNYTGSHEAYPHPTGIYHGTLPWDLPTGTFHVSSGPTTPPTVYAREVTEADCVHWSCFLHGCSCNNSDEEASTDVSASTGDQSSVEARDESDTAIFYVRNEAAVEGECKDWICAWNTCECYSAGGKFTVSKALAGLAFIGAVVAGLV